MSNDKNTMIRSQQVKQILKAVPHWTIRWGNTVLLLIVAGLLCATWFIRYPEVVNTEAELTTYRPDENRYVVNGWVPDAEAHKISTGQHVEMSIPVFPDDRYGKLIGNISYVAGVPNSEGLYRFEVTLPNGLRTSNNEQLPYTAGLVVNAEIITNDLRLLERIFSKAGASF